MQSSISSLIIPAYFVDASFIKMTNNCVKSVGDQVDEVIVIDDGSPENPSGMFKHRKTRRLVRTADNSGYSAASNTGLKTAQGDILILGNNDLIFHENWLTGLLFPLNAGFDISTCWTSDQDYVLEDRISEGDKFGSLFAMKRKVYDSIGGFDEQFRGYFSDLDYRKRAMEAGFKIGMNRSMVVEHRAKSTYEKTDPDDTEYLRGMRLYEAKWGVVD